MDILVTGGSGAMGHYIVQELDRRNHQVTVLDIDEPTSENRDRISEFFKADITNANEVSQAVESADAIIHTAALLGAEKENPLLANEVNVKGTLNVLESAKETEKRVIVFSSKAAFGSLPPRNTEGSFEPIGEDAPKDPESVYGTTKLACEKFCQIYFNNYDLDVAVVRFSSTYGVGKESRGKFGIVSDIVTKAYKGENINIPSGDQKDDFVYFGDIANSMAAIVETENLKYPCYHIGSGTLNTLRDFGNVLQKLCPEAQINVEDGYNFYNQEYPHYCLMDTSRAESDLGYSPTYSLREALEDYLDRL